MVAANPRERWKSEITPITPVAYDAESAIQSANQELEQRVGGGMNLALSVLVEQRDRALRSAQSACEAAERDREAAERDREARVVDQDSFIADMVAEHQKQLATLQETLQAAYAEIDDTRADAARLQEERDNAVRETSDLRFELEKQLEAARAEAIDLEWQIDEGHRKITDLSDQARDDAYRAGELLDEVRRQLDERNEELCLLRARLMVQDGDMQSGPPPAPASEPEATRREAPLPRKEAPLPRRSVLRAKSV